MRYQILPLFLLSACASVEKLEPKIENAFVVSMADDSFLIDGSLIKLSIYDGGLMDAPMQPIYYREIKVVGDKSVAFYQAMLIPKGPYEKLSMPSFSVRIEKDGKLLAINKSAIRVKLEEKIQFLKLDKVN